MCYIKLYSVLVFVVQPQLWPGSSPNPNQCPNNHSNKIIKDTVSSPDLKCHPVIMFLEAHLLFFAIPRKPTLYCVVNWRGCENPDYKGWAPLPPLQMHRPQELTQNGPLQSSCVQKEVSGGKSSPGEGGVLWNTGASNEWASWCKDNQNEWPCVLEMDKICRICSLAAKIPSWLPVLR